MILPDAPPMTTADLERAIADAREGITTDDDGAPEAVAEILDRLARIAPARDESLEDLARATFAALAANP